MGDAVGGVPDVDTGEGRGGERDGELVVELFGEWCAGWVGGKEKEADEWNQVGLVTPPLNDAAPYGSFVFYAVMTLLGLLWTYCEYLAPSA